MASILAKPEVAKLLEKQMKNKDFERFLMLGRFQYGTQLAPVGDKLAQGGWKLTAGRLKLVQREATVSYTHLTLPTIYSV